MWCFKKFLFEDKANFLNAQVQTYTSLLSEIESSKNKQNSISNEIYFAYTDQCNLFGQLFIISFELK